MRGYYVVHDLDNL